MSHALEQAEVAATTFEAARLRDARRRPRDVRQPGREGGSSTNPGAHTRAADAGSPIRRAGTQLSKGAQKG